MHQINTGINTITVGGTTEKILKIIIFQTLNWFIINIAISFYWEMLKLYIFMINLNIIELYYRILADESSNTNGNSNNSTNQPIALITVNSSISLVINK
jgi:hypothetical protein